jgi:hypothetical protein
MVISSDQDARQFNVSDTVLTAVVESYYPDVARAGTSARARAQAAQSVATIFATGLVAGLTLTDLRQQPMLIRILGCLAVLSWAVAAILYMRAVGKAVPLDERITGVDDADQLVRIVLERAKAERIIVDRQQHRANLASVVALCLTSAVFVGAALLPAPETTKAAVFSTTQEQMIVLQNQCKLPGPTIPAAVDVATLKNSTVDLIVRCDGKKLWINLPRSDLKGLVILER